MKVGSELNSMGRKDLERELDELKKNPDTDQRMKCTVCGRELTRDEACYTNMQNLFEGRFVCLECGM